MKTDFNVKTKMISSIRKIWKHSPLRKAALEMNCLNPHEIQKKRLYKCEKCGKNFYAQHIEIDHVGSSKHTSYDRFLSSMMCGIVKIPKGQKGETREWFAILESGHSMKLEELVVMNLMCLCLDCHKQKTKEERKKKK